MGLHTFHGPKSSRNSVLPCFAESQSIHGRPKLTLGLLIDFKKLNMRVAAPGVGTHSPQRSAMSALWRWLSVDLGRPPFHAVPWCAGATTSAPWGGFSKYARYASLVS